MLSVYSPKVCVGFLYLWGCIFRGLGCEGRQGSDQYYYWEGGTSMSRVYWSEGDYGAVA